MFGVTFIWQNPETQNLETNCDVGNFFYKFRANSEENLNNIDSLLMFSLRVIFSKMMQVQSIYDKVKI